MRYFALLMVLLVSIGGVVAGEAENITACVAKAKEFAGVSLDPFAVKYKGNLVNNSIADWPNAYCEVKSGQVYNLSINYREIIYEGYSGKASYDLAIALKYKTNEAIKQMRSRIALLEQRSNQASNSLRKPNPDHQHLAQYVDEGIQKSLGTQVSFPSKIMSDRPNVAAEQQHPNSSGISLKQPEIRIPRTSPGDKGKYFLIEAKNDDGIYTTLHKRVGIDATGFSKTQIDCKKMQYRDMGYSEVSVTNIEDKPGNWTELVDGSSKSDLVRFICN